MHPKGATDTDSFVTLPVGLEKVLGPDTRSHVKSAVRGPHDYFGDRIRTLETVAQLAVCGGEWSEAAELIVDLVESSR